MRLKASEAHKHATKVYNKILKNKKISKDSFSRISEKTRIDNERIMCMKNIF